MAVYDRRVFYGFGAHRAPLQREVAAVAATGYLTPRRSAVAALQNRLLPQINLFV